MCCIQVRADVLLRNVLGYREIKETGIAKISINNIDLRCNRIYPDQLSNKIGEIKWHKRHLSDRCPEKRG